MDSLSLSTTDFRQLTPTDWSKLWQNP